MTDEKMDPMAWLKDGLISIAVGAALTLLVFLVATKIPIFTYCLPGVALAWWLLPEGIMGGETFILGLFVNALVYGLVCLICLRLWSRNTWSARNLR